MGSSVSAQLLQQVQSTALVTQKPCLVVTSTPLCAEDGPTTLLVHRNETTDATTGALVFVRKEKAFTMHDHQSLHNTHGKRLLVMRTRGTFTIKYNILDGGDQDVLLGEVKIDRLDHKTNVTATIWNRATKQQTSVVVTGNWRGRTALIWREVQGGRRAIAKVLKAPKGYILVIAVGVELALVVMLCRAMEAREEFERDDGRRMRGSGCDSHC